ncbi:MAG: FAD-dependent oxidoreductase [Oscillatoriales cyanobacterium RM2_1_1]|nr:FAD-dependent oxidoreductase [Oscillatoriales cyanobacterium SM2_3_0]NJO45131.1 FAD-dependent oxidoreductase [Oscillatoriales cyanobacterium RM2_1_1]
MTTEILTTEVLVVGGGTGGTAAALQSARRGAKTLLVSEFPWLGGMLTTAGVSAPDGNELLAFQTGIWGRFLQALQDRHPQGLNHGWVSFFNFDPRIGAAIFADWVRQEPNLNWISGQTPLEVLRRDNQILGVRFADFTVRAEITLDATELGDLLALGDVPHRWGWELHSQWQEPSAPIIHNELTQTYPIQAPTWVALLQQDESAPEIPAAPIDQPEQFAPAYSRYGPEAFLNYGRLPGGLLMINWPHWGNDYGQGVNRLIESGAKRQEFLQESFWHTQSFLRWIQAQVGRGYGLAPGVFPDLLPQTFNQAKWLTSLGSRRTAFALHPYYRESRRLQGLTTMTELEILPMPGGQVAALPMNSAGICEAIALGNYPNDHHYPGWSFPVNLKQFRWGGRWTGTPFSISYGALVPEQIDGLLVCEKNISVSHMANGSTRLQPTVLGIGQAAGMAAALCIQARCQPRNLSVQELQGALLSDPVAPMALVPLLNLPPYHPEWLPWQRYYLRHPEAYPAHGNCPLSDSQQARSSFSMSASADPQLQEAQLQGPLQPSPDNSSGFKPRTIG